MVQKYNFTYDANGMRTKRTNGTTTYTYVYNGGQLTQMTVGSDVLHFSYDASGRPMTVTLNETVYYYAVNVQGDVVGILDQDGNAVANYVYNAWGDSILVSGLDAVGYFNPLRYRGYVYDSETELYYLQSRYYDPELGRFLNPDSLASTGQGILGCNMFAYCNNNPVSNADYSGEDAIYVVDFTAGRGLPIVGHALLFVQDEKGNWYQTEFAGRFPDKSTGRIRTFAVEENQIQSFLESGTTKSIYISGDFTASYKLAKKYNGTDFGGYKFLGNNCLHYVKKILKKGSPENKRLSKVFSGSDFVPARFYAKLNVTQRISDIYKRIRIFLWR